MLLAALFLAFCMKMQYTSAWNEYIAITIFIIMIFLLFFSSRTSGQSQPQYYDLLVL